MPTPLSTTLPAPTAEPAPRAARGALAWPVPALAAWALSWAGFMGAGRAGLPTAGAISLGLACGLACALALRGASRWRRGWVAAGFPLSLAAVLISAQVGHWPAWIWLLPLAVLLALYPLRAWRDAPLFPTPRGALDALRDAAPLPAGARVLDIGCGLGDGLQALQRAYPDARLEGIEHSAPLALLARLRCRFARVRRGDMWALDWGGYDLVYLFQRPESMARAAAKAAREMRAGSWLVSLEFEMTGHVPSARLDGAAGRPVWVYRIGAGPQSQEITGAGPVNSSNPATAKNSSRQRRRR